MFAPAASTVTGLTARNCMVHNTAEAADASKLVITPGQIRDQKRSDFSKIAYGLDTHLEVEEKPADTTCHAKIDSFLFCGRAGPSPRLNCVRYYRWCS